MEPIFPENITFRPIESQQDLDEAFLQYPQFAKAYIKTALYQKDTRDWYEKNWPKVYKYLDKDFVSKFQMEAEHDARAWEFHVVAILLEKGCQFKEKTWTYGPDFCIAMPDGRNLWIEAITCNLGKVDPVEPYPDLKPGIIYSFGGNIEDEQRPRALRITSAIATKFEQFNKYLNNAQKTGVNKGDYLLIAVNGQAIQHFSDSGRLFKRAIFGQGPDVLVRKAGEEKFQGGFYKPVPLIPKNTGTKEDLIPATFMEMDEFSKISAVLYCGNHVSTSWNNGFQPGDDFLFGYHSNPLNPIPERTFNFGSGIRKNTQTGAITDQKQSDQ
jgi:hypothetical protein